MRVLERAGWIAGPNVLVFRRFVHDLPNDPNSGLLPSPASKPRELATKAEEVSLGVEPRASAQGATCPGAAGREIVGGPSWASR